MDAANEELDIIAGPQGSSSLQRDHRDYRRFGIIADTSKWRRKKKKKINQLSFCLMRSLTFFTHG